MTASKGLEGIIAAQSSISSIVGATLTYRGYNIDDLATNSEFEEVVYLLWYGKLPNIDELTKFKEELNSMGNLPNEIIETIKKFPKDVNPMAALRTAVSTLSLYDPDMQDLSDEANLRKAKRLLTQISTIVAAFHRVRNDLEPLSPDPSLSFAENFLYMLNGEKPDKISIEAFNKALVLHADHEFNASTFASRVTVATLSDMHSGIVSAIGTLKGPLHGGANERVMAMLEEIGELDRIEAYLEEKFAKKEKIMGIGHRVYKQGDPRAKHLKEMSRQLGELNGDTKWYDMSVKINEIVTAKIGLLPNVDFYSASVYTYLGIPRDLFTPIFAISRTSGWTAHMMEQYRNNRLIRPRAEYTGPTHQEYVPIEKR
ncbi:citrate synthase [Vulcanibacillus modesticaldus]|uniref:Citrate synthase n=1 Tax=Vulcanibacillus modesticaldus TaxID=337097 RepID=A0A1D2YWF6_9BACI|nr:citrate synthase [Vulcanibacillus modesticaldus]OEG00081.1 citrate synthase [Vulcanibacillus modesticaldus]